MNQELYVISDETVEIPTPQRKIPKPRNHKFDNLRAILIILVVFGHLLETFSGSARGIIYNVIYTFHMPCFIFVTGYFAKFNAKKILKRFLLPYIVFQTLYCIFDLWVLHRRETLSLQYTTPYWLMWYLLSVMCYYMFIPMIKTTSVRNALIVLGTAFAVAIYIGTDTSVYRFLSFSRTVVFFPFFALGYYSATAFKTGKLMALRDKALPYVIGASVFVAVFGEYLVIKLQIPKNLLYGTMSYEKAQSSIWHRILVFFVALSVIVILLAVVPNKKIPLLSALGQGTFPVFLLHGFVVRLFLTYKYFNYLNFSEGVNILISFGIAIVLCALFGNTLIKKLFAILF